MPDGRTVKQRNTVISLGVLVPAAIIASLFHPSLLTWLISFPLAIIWANWFEYFYHRWLDHTPGQYYEEKHRSHHQEPENDEHVNFGANVLSTFMVYLVNGLPVVLADLLWFRTGFSAVVLVAFIFYVLVCEEVHWRVHMGGWIPFGMGRQHHQMHHKRPMSRFNVFLPLFDWIFGTLK